MLYDKNNSSDSVAAGMATILKSASHKELFNKTAQQTPGASSALNLGNVANQ